MARLIKLDKNGQRRLVRTLEDHHGWKGELAGRNSKRSRARRLKPTPERCEGCGEPRRPHRGGKDSLQVVFLDEDSERVVPSNIRYLCVKCRMKRDGTYAHLQRRLLKPHGKKRGPCAVCGREGHLRVHGRCGRCNWYFSRHGVERPRVEDLNRFRTRGYHGYFTKDPAQPPRN